MSYIQEERETHISTSDIDCKWTIYTRQKKIINKLIKLGYEMFDVELQEDVVVGCSFLLDFNKITFKKAIVNNRTYTDEEREEIKNRLQKGRGYKQL